MSGFHVAARVARGAVQSFESREASRETDRSSRRLTPEERGTLMLLWGGYEQSAGCRSAFGAVLDAALRAPPRERPIWRLVVAEIERRGGRVPLESLVQAIADEGMATPHEVRRAVRAMRLNRWVSQYTQDMPRRRQDSDPTTGAVVETTVHIPTEMLKLDEPAGRERTAARTREERWAAEDAELYSFCGGTIPCHETRTMSGRVPDEFGSAPTVKMPRLMGLDRCILERVYGSSFHPAYRDVFGAEIAAVVEYTGAAEDARVSRGLATIDQALKAVLDESPKDLAGQVKWRGERERFVRQVKAEGERLIVGACAAFRKAMGQ